MATQDKYDRQLRLWGADGQRALGSAHILLLNGGPTATETMKNLVLPGIGRFSIVDSELVCERDLANNFFVTHDSLTKPRAQVTCELLKELNPDVEGDFHVKDPVEFVKTCTDVKQFKVVIATGLRELQILEIEQVFHPHNVPIVVARTYGFTGYLRIITQVHCVIKSNPSPAPAEDIRLADPFDTLASYVDGVNLEHMDSKEYKHVPYVVMLIKLMQQWKQDHGGKFPSNMEEKNAFKQSIRAAARKPWGEEENLLEAMENAFLAYAPRPVPDEVEMILQDPLCENIDLSHATSGNYVFNAKFWVLAKALKEFVKTSNNKLPLSGVLPDMTSTTSSYVDLQKIYKEKAEQDAVEIHNLVKGVLKQHQHDPEWITIDEVRAFCKNAAHIRVTKSSPMSDEVQPDKINKEDIEMAIMEGVGDSGPQCPILFYFILRACDHFYEKHQRFPGENGKLELDAAVESDATILLEIAHQLIKEIDLSCQPNITLDHAKEFVRYAGIELHNIAAVLGGIASQEVVKLVTHQYTVVNNTYVFNGITCTSQTYQL